MAMRLEAKIPFGSLAGASWGIGGTIDIGNKTITTGNFDVFAVCELALAQPELRNRSFVVCIDQKDRAVAMVKDTMGKLFKFFFEVDPSDQTAPLLQDIKQCQKSSAAYVEFTLILQKQYDPPNYEQTCQKIASAAKRFRQLCLN
jgi:hypothetical protein